MSNTLFTAVLITYNLHGNKDDDFSAWIERFELFVLFNEINAHKKN